MADRDVTVDIIARDKTGQATTSAENNLKRVSKQSSFAKRQLTQMADHWSNTFSKMHKASERWANSGDGIGKKAVRGILKGIDALSTLGGRIGEGFKQAMQTAGPIIQTAVAVALAGVALAAGPAIAGAIVGGAAGVGIVGGLALASRDARVQSAFNSLKQYASDSLQNAAESFVPATINAVRIAKGKFGELVPYLRRIFDASSGFVAPLTRALGDGARAALSGIAQAVEKARPIMAVIGKAITEVGDAVGDVFRDLSDNGQSMALALKIAFNIVEGAVRIVGISLNFLVETFEFLINHIPGAKKALELYAGGAVKSKEGSDTAAGGIRGLGSAASTAATQLQNLHEKQQAMADSNVSLYRAQIASREAVSSATAAIEKNNKAKLTNKQRADANMKSLLDAADAFNTEATAGERSGISAGKASAAYATNRAKLIAMAEKAGFSKQKAEELAAQLLKIPKNVNTDVNVNTSTAMGKLETLQKKIKNTKGKTVTITVQVLSNGNHRMPGGGQLTFADAAYTSWQGAGVGGGTSRTGGPVKVESTVNQTLNVSLDGAPFRSYTARAINESERRTAWRQKVGRR